MRKIAVGDLGEFWYGDYKEPFEQLEGGVPGHPVGVVLKDDDGRLLCAFCGKTYDNLGRHIHAHGMTARSYKNEVGLLQKSALVSEHGRQQLIAVGLRNRDAGLGIASGKFRNVGTRKGDARPEFSAEKNPAWTAEHLNRTGRCYAQVLAVCRDIVLKEKRLTAGALRRRGIGPSVIQAYGGLDRLALLSGGKAWRKHGRWTKTELALGLKGVAEKIGRTPSQSDIKRYGLPDLATYVAHFGSWNGAIRYAGLPTNLAGRFVPLTMADRVDILSRYAISGSVKRVAESAHTSSPRVTQVLAQYGIVIRPGWQRTFEHELAKSQAAEIARRLADWPEETAA